MSEKKYFKWLARSCYPRKKFYDGQLLTGETYKAADFPIHIVEEWVKTGAAKWTTAKPKEETK